MYVRDVLVPIDFSPSSLVALDAAVALVQPGGEIYLLHVVDAEFVRHLVEEGFGEAEALIERLRNRAQRQMDAVLKAQAGRGLNFEGLVAVGRPVGEILKLSHEMDFSMIVLAMHGRHSGDAEEVLFGSVAEKVLRGARIPVLCVPSHPPVRNQPEPVDVAAKPVADPR